MSSAKSSGAQPSASASSAKHREHNQGQQNREFTPAQKAAVDRVNKCKATAYYEILDIKVEATDGEVKKSYRKLALLMHPDKNGAPGADEAFKLVSRAFQVLSDPTKRATFDRTGGDPDIRGFGGASAGANPFSSGFSGGTPRGGRYEDEISPEDLFNMFFGGNAFGGGFGGGGGGGGTFFDLGGGPAIRIHHFGGPRPQRRRARNPNDPDPPAQERTISQILTQLAPLIVLVIFPLLSSLFNLSSGGENIARGPTIRFDSKPPVDHKRVTPNYKIPYYVNAAEISGFDSRKFSNLDWTAERKYVRNLQAKCEVEYETRQRRLEESHGWFFVDQEKYKRAQDMPMRHCQRLKDMGIAPSIGY